MEDKYEEVRLEWINFLERFSANQINIEFSNKETKYVTYTMENILDTNITISDRYGFLTATFDEEKKKVRFLEIIKIIYPTEEDEKSNIEELNNFKSIYPCRIFISNRGMVNFYDNEKLTPNELLLNRILVFKNIMTIILTLKIEKISINLFRKENN
ncbi:hypothetical protein ABF176_002539 [Flavobacterium psychrophilum]